jgi:hypothetical protein
VEIELRVVQFWTEIKLVITNRTPLCGGEWAKHVYIAVLLRRLFFPFNVFFSRKIGSIYDDFKWSDHIGIITVKAANSAKRLYLLRLLKRAEICTRYLIIFYCSIIRSVLEHSCQFFHRSLPNYLY